MSSPHNFRVNWVSSALTVLLFLSFAFAASGHGWSDTGAVPYGQYATTEYRFSGRDVGTAVSPEEYWTSGVREENGARLYGLAHANGRGSHGPKGYYRWPMNAETWAGAYVWFEDTIGGWKYDDDIYLYYRVVARAGQDTIEQDSDTVNMVRKKVYYNDENGMRTFRWDISESKSLSKTVSAAGHTNYDPSMGSHPHYGGALAIVGSLPTGLIDPSRPNMSRYVRAFYESPSP